MFSLNKSNNNYKYINKFREKSLAERKNTSDMIKFKYINRVPIIVDCTDKITLDKNKYIVPNDLSIAQFIFIIKKRLKINPSDAIFITCNNKLINSNTTIEYVYNKEMSDDGFLYFIISLENVFG